jgi:hypothetical protein
MWMDELRLLDLSINYRVRSDNYGKNTEQN